jgi:hypothetical protein
MTVSRSLSYQDFRPFVKPPPDDLHDDVAAAVTRHNQALIKRRLKILRDSLFWEPPARKKGGCAKSRVPSLRRDREPPDDLSDLREEARELEERGRSLAFEMNPQLVRCDSDHGPRIDAFLYGDLDDVPRVNVRPEHMIAISAPAWEERARQYFRRQPLTPVRTSSNNETPPFPSLFQGDLINTRFNFKGYELSPQNSDRQ